MPHHEDGQRNLSMWKNSCESTADWRATIRTRQHERIDEINTGELLKSYVSFFCLLWFTWCQVSLFDVRFVVDSTPERPAKACQFAVMIGLAVVVYKFDPSSQNGVTFKTIAVALGISLLVLALQYMGVSTICTYVAWYILAIGELLVNIDISSFSKDLTFEGTHLVQRMGLLTLIILVEVIIVICKNIAKIVLTQDAAADGDETIGKKLEIFAIAFVYFFIITSISLILLNTLNVIARRHKMRLDWLRISFNYATGTILCCLSIFSNNQTACTNNLLSVWILPPVGFALLAVLWWSTMRIDGGSEHLV
ncbi:hypothetical protein BJ878DRAFT_482824 [Calycina marina]|uniref:Uncharacterized protein n=1 Tax=Calycina marina TaxID=1763456 RepID=A0A9P8CDR4_9HELO|nr:hypothetical protein BJ878DRAFT_482824 [Calycina marina]